MRNLILLFVLCGASAMAAPAFVQGNICTNGTAGASLTCAFGSNVTSGNTIVLIGRWDTAVGTETVSASISSGTATCGTWNKRVAETSGGTSGGTIHFRMFAFECKVASTGSATIQMTVSASKPYRDMSIMEYSPTAGQQLVFDVEAHATNLGSSLTTTCSSGATATLATANELAVGYCGGWNGSVTWGANAPWTNRSTASNIGMGVYDQVTSSTAAVTFSYTLPVSDEIGAMVLTFKEQAAGGGSPATTQIIVTQ